MSDVQEIHADIEACDRALDALLTAMIAHDAAKPTPANPKITFVSALLAQDLDRTRFETLMKDPVRISLREGLKRVAREIHRLGGGSDALLDSFEKVASLDPANYGRRAAIMNSAFDGIGTGNDRWWA